MKTKLRTMIQSPVEVTVMSRVISYGLVMTLSLIWGLAFVAIRRAEFELSAVNLTILR